MARDKVTIKIPGLRGLGKELANMGDELGAQKALTSMKTTMKPVQADIYTNAPVDQGSLKESIRMEAKRDRKGLVVKVTVGKNGPHKTTKKGKHKPVYALQAEFGTDDTPEHKFIRPAFDGKEEQISKRLFRLLNNTILQWKNTPRK